MSDKTLNEIIKEEFVKLMSELDQSIISEQPVNVYGEPITPEKIADVEKRKARLQKKLASQKRTAAASEKAARAAAATDDIARGMKTDAALKRQNLTRADYAEQTAKTGPDMAGVPKGLPAAKNIARANRQGKRALARRNRRKAGQKAIGGDYDKFYAELDAAGLSGLLGKAGKDRDFGKAHQAAFDALQAHKSRMSVPVEAGGDLYDRAGFEAAAKGDTDALKVVGTRDAAKQQTVAGAPSLDLSDLPDPQGMSEPEEEMVAGSALGKSAGALTAGKPKPFRFDQNPMQESKQLDRMNLLAGIKKRDK